MYIPTVEASLKNTICHHYSKKFIKKKLSKRVETTNFQIPVSYAIICLKPLVKLCFKRNLDG